MRSDNPTNNQPSKNMTTNNEKPAASDLSVSAGSLPCRFKDAGDFTITDAMRYSVTDCKDFDKADEIQRLGHRLKHLISENDQMDNGE